MTCDVTGSAGITECEPAGTVTEYKACGGVGMCAVGLTCMDGACKSTCNTAADCPGAGRTCQPVYYGGFPIPGFDVCSSACDPTNAAASCGPGLSCLATTNTALDCVGPAGAGTGPGSCVGVLCAPGYMCIAGATYDCKKWCKVGGSDCASGETCAPIPPGYITGLVTVNGVSYGLCQ
jgi:hypothetical protein